MLNTGYKKEALKKCEEASTKYKKEYDITIKKSTGTWKEGMRNQAGEKGKTEEARAETGTGKAAARRNREEKERKSRG